jgi:hypothetical protein
VSELFKTFDRLAHPQPNNEAPGDQRKGSRTQLLFSSDLMSSRKKRQ